MAATTEARQTQDSLSCGVCFEKYNSSNHLPKILPCQHTFCSACIDSLSKEGYDEALDCPVCRCTVHSSADIRTNLAVRDIVEELQSQPSQPLTCPDHPNKQCYMICTDCWQPLCTVCMKELRKSIHKDHDIDDLEDATVSMQEKLATKLEENIAELDKTSAAKIDQLMKESETHAQQVNTVETMVINTVTAWKEEQLATRKRRSQQAIDSYTDMCRSRKASWTEKLKFKKVQDIVDAYKEASNTSEAMTGDVRPNIKLQQENMDQLQDRLCALCDTMRASMMISDDMLSPVDSAANLPHEDDARCLNSKLDNITRLEAAHMADSEVQPDATKAPVPSPRAGKLTPSDEAVVAPVPDVTEVVSYFVGSPVSISAHQPTSSTTSSSICPECNADIPMCLSRKANLYNLKRNKKFHRVVHDRRRQHDELLCLTDDFIFTAYLDGDRSDHWINGRWDPHEGDLEHIFDWDDVSDDSEYRDDIKRAKTWWKQKLFDLRSGKINIDWE